MNNLIANSLRSPMRPGRKSRKRPPARSRLSGGAPVVDVPDPKGVALAAVGSAISSHRGAGEGVQAATLANALVELRVPFTLAPRRSTTWTAARRIRTGAAEGSRAQNRLRRRSRGVRRIRRRRDRGHSRRRQQRGFDAPVRREGLSGRGGAGGQSIAPRGVNGLMCWCWAPSPTPSSAAAARKAIRCSSIFTVWWTVKSFGARDRGRLVLTTAAATSNWTSGRTCPSATQPHRRGRRTVSAREFHVPAVDDGSGGGAHGAQKRGGWLKSDNWNSVLALSGRMPGSACDRTGRRRSNAEGPVVGQSVLAFGAKFKIFARACDLQSGRWARARRWKGRRRLAASGRRIMTLPPGSHGRAGLSGLYEPIAKRSVSP